MLDIGSACHLQATQLSPTLTEGHFMCRLAGALLSSSFCASPVLLLTWHPVQPGRCCMCDLSMWHEGQLSSRVELKANCFSPRWLLPLGCRNGLQTKANPLSKSTQPLFFFSLFQFSASSLSLSGLYTRICISPRLII